MFQGQTLGRHRTSGAKTVKTVRRRRIDDLDVEKVQSTWHGLSCSFHERARFEGRVEGARQVEVEDEFCVGLSQVLSLSNNWSVESFISQPTYSQHLIQQVRSPPRNPRRLSNPTFLPPTELNIECHRSRTLAPNHRLVFTFENPSENPLTCTPSVSNRGDLNKRGRVDSGRVHLSSQNNFKVFFLSFLFSSSFIQSS